MDNLAQQLEAVLFYAGEELSLTELAKIAHTSVDEVRVALEELESKLGGRGVVLVRSPHDSGKGSEKVALGTHPDAHALIERMRVEELERDPGKAGMETLSVVLYNHPITKAQIDHIRGVNSSSILRNLLIRGLIEKVQNPDDQRTFLYHPTKELLAYLGVKNIKELPDYEKILHELHAVTKPQGDEKKDGEDTVAQEKPLEDTEESSAPPKEPLNIPIKQVGSDNESPEQRFVPVKNGD